MAKLKKEDIIFNEKVAQRIKEIRKASEGVSSKFAEQNNVGRQLIYRWENPVENRGISIHSIRRFCKMVNMSLSEFFDSKLFS